MPLKCVTKRAEYQILYMTFSDWLRTPYCEPKGKTGDAVNHEIFSGSLNYLPPRYIFEFRSARVGKAGNTIHQYLVRLANGAGKIFAWKTPPIT